MRGRLARVAMLTRGRTAVAMRMDRMRGRLARAAVLVLLAGAFGACVSPTDPLGREEALEEAQRRYTELVRWGEAEQAGRYVDPELRDEFVRLARQLGDLRITDYEIGEIERQDDSAVVTVTYEGYAVATLVERSARERQEWFRAPGLANVWLVRPGLAEVVAALRGTP